MPFTKKQMRAKHVTFEFLQIDDHFRLGGDLYRITDIRTYGLSGDITITARVVVDDNSQEGSQIYVQASPYTFMKIYNQKRRKKNKNR